MLPADHAAQEMLGGDLAALEVEGVAVGIEGLAAVFADLAKSAWSVVEEAVILG